MATAGLVDISGFRFVGGDANYNEGAHIAFAGLDGWQNFRIHHCAFVNANKWSIRGSAATEGLIDNNTFSGTSLGISLYGRGIADWDEATFSLGTIGAFFIEDNIYDVADDYGSTGRGATDLSNGGRVVFRHNTCKYAFFQASDFVRTTLPAPHAWEIYYNSFTTDTGHYKAIDVASGSGVIFNNIITSTGSGYWSVPIGAVDYKSSDPRTYHLCDGTDSLDQNTSGETGWRCHMQLGSHHYGSSAIGMPVYVWGNTYNGATTNMSCTLGCSVGGRPHLSAGRDFINGTTKPGYSAYTYPHPLQSSGGVLLKSAQEQFDGETGGSWIPRAFYDSGNSPSLSLQTADLPLAGTIGGGSDSSISASLSIVLGFALYLTQARVPPILPSIVRGFYAPSFDQNELLTSGVASRVDSLRSEVPTATHMVLTVCVRVPGGSTSNTVVRDTIAENPAHISSWSSLVRSRGIEPALMIMLFSDNSFSSADNWTPSDPTAALSSYYTAIYPYIQAAQSASFQFVIIANGMGSLFSNSSAVTGFTDLFALARADYSGAIGLSVTRDDILQNIVSLADFMEFQATVPLATTNSPTLAEMFTNLTGTSQVTSVRTLVDSRRTLWNNSEVTSYMSYLRVLASRWGKKILLRAEYKSTTGAAIDPVNQVETTVDNVIQMNAWQSFLSAVFDSLLGVNNGMLMGVLGWEWHPGSSTDDPI